MSIDFVAISKNVNDRLARKEYDTTDLYSMYLGTRLTWVANRNLQIGQVDFDFVTLTFWNLVFSDNFLMERQFVEIMDAAKASARLRECYNQFL